MTPFRTSLDVEVMTGGIAVLDVRWRGCSPRMPYARFYAIRGGEAEIRHHSRTFVLRPNHLYLIPSESTLEFRCETSLDIVWVHFRVSLGGGRDLFEVCDCLFERELRDPAATCAVLEDVLHSLDAARGAAAGVRVQGALLRLLGPFVSDRVRPAAEPAVVRRLRPLCNYMAEHLSEPLRVRDLARRAGYETNYFSAQFRHAFGVPPLRYLHRRRMEQARLQLMRTDRTLEAIAQSLGYSDAFHFSKTFKRLTGHTPSAFRAVAERRQG